ncbi:MAG: hypothetical protein EZS28_046083 [Streblomastix strix]|uniref:Uncharacterized protein n=1 Tax=Streblomastix strix TaxID=222440 RepID=A0A5J4TKN8_9EUKA|nr:MAG: hypothetical protein EZS28_046083 [Streblomastix strix]
MIRLVIALTYLQSRIFLHLFLVPQSPFLTVQHIPSFQVVVHGIPCISELILTVEELLLKSNQARFHLSKTDTFSQLIYSILTQNHYQYHYLSLFPSADYHAPLSPSEASIKLIYERQFNMTPHFDWKTIIIMIASDLLMEQVEKKVETLIKMQTVVIASSLDIS